jgi:zinc carboxypeptidase
MSYQFNHCTRDKMSLILLVFAYMLSPAVPTFSDDADNIETRLMQIPQPWIRKMHLITPNEYETTMRFWSEKHPQFVELETAGITKEGSPIFLMKISNRSLSDDDKQVCLITALHCGPERSGTTTILHLIEWLISDSPDAIETRRKQIVLLMPIVNPYAFFVTDRFGNSQGIEPYTGGGMNPYTGGSGTNWDFETMTFKELEKSPEISAVLSVVDEYKPEVHADIHGVGLQEYPKEELSDRKMYQGQTMFEVTGSAYSNYALRPWDWRVTEAIISAGMEAGFPSDRFEADAQRGYWGPALNSISDRLWLGRPNFYTSQYGYVQYHTMVSTFEVGWEQSGVARLKGLLNIGNTVWEGDHIPGYPVDRVKPFIGHFITASGITASERRESRVELWQQQGAFSQGILYPQTDGRDTYMVALTEKGSQLLDPNKDTFIGNIRDMPDIHVGNVEAFLNAGPEIKVYVEHGRPSTRKSSDCIKYGMGLRLRIPYRKPELVDLRLNGHLLRESATDGYQTWFGNGFTQVQINIPPEQTANTDLFIVTCGYKPDVKWTYGWQPPQEVADRMKADGDNEK